MSPLCAVTRESLALCRYNRVLIHNQLSHLVMVNYSKNPKSHVHLKWSFQPNKVKTESFALQGLYGVEAICS